MTPPLFYTDADGRTVTLSHIRRAFDPNWIIAVTEDGRELMLATTGRHGLGLTRKESKDNATKNSPNPI